MTKKPSNKPVKKPASNHSKAKKPTNKVNKPKGKTTKNRKKKNNKQDFSSLLLNLGFQLVFLFAIIAAVVLLVLYQTLFGRLEQSKQLVEVEQGQSYYGMVPDWKENVPMFSETFAKLYIKTFIDKPLHVGTYQMPKNPSFLEAMNVIEQGADAALVKVQIIEGKTAKTLYDKLRDTKGIKIEVLNLPPEELKLALGIDAITPKGEFNSNLEGWFAPNTYTYAEGTSDKTILIDLYKRQKHLLDLAWENRATDLPYKSPYDALIMASIIEKETGLPEERAEVAGVFVNRLKKGMRLQTDPTIIYGMGEHYDGNIRKKDIEEKTAYNTYQIDGLPPTPIALPSAAAIHAALNPADTKSLFFVATGKGGHKFSETYEEHKQAVTEYLEVIGKNKTEPPIKNNGETNDNDH